MRIRRALPFATAVAASLVPSPALAVDWEVAGDVTTQGYEVVSPWGDVVLGRRRLTSTLGLASYNLQGGDVSPTSATYSVQMRMRVDADFGVRDGETGYDPSRRGLFTPGLQVAPVDVMFGFVEGRNLFQGLLDFRVGRQYTTNVLGWWSFDGGLVRATTPYHVAVEAYGGFEQRGGLPLSTGRFESQGVWRGVRDDALANDAYRYPSYQFAAVAPAFGVALETSGWTWLKARVDYRRVYNTGEAFTGQFPTAGATGNAAFERYDDVRISSDRVGASLSTYLGTLGGLRGGVVYDLYNGALSRGYAALDVPIGRRTTVGLDGDYFLPTFDADSIFNWFTHNPSASALARVSTRPNESLQLSAQAGTKLWLASGDPTTWAAAQCQAAGFTTAEQLDACVRYGIDSTNWYTSPNGGAYEFARNESNRATQVSPDLVANANAAYTWRTGRADVRTMVQTGFGDVSTNRGRRAGGTVSAQQAIVPGLFWLGGRVSTYDWHDPLRPDRDATSFGYVIAPEVRPLQFGTVRVEWEHEMNRLVGQRFRVLAMLSMRVAP